MPKTSAKNNEIVPELPADRAIFQNEERPAMMYVGKRTEDKPGWKKLTQIPADRVLKRTETGMFVLGKKE